ncbi:unnamed protein product [Sympodiomycopsis kandeliae]
MPSLQELEEWIDGSIPSNIRQLPHNITETVFTYSEAVYEQLTKYGSPVHLPTLEQLEQHLPSNPFGSATKSIPAKAPPPPQGWFDKSSDWMTRHKRVIQIGSGIIVLGLGTSSAYHRGYLWLPFLGRKQITTSGKHISSSNKNNRQPMVENGARKEAVVVIGADTPLGRALALHLSSIGFIVIASVSSHTALASFNSLIPPSSRGYIKALLFDTSDVASSLGKFIRSVDEVLKLRFPLLSAGDPYAAPGNQVDLVGAINTLSYVAPSQYDSNAASVSASGAASLPSPASFQSNPAELAEAMEKHVVASLCAISALQPLLASSPQTSARSASVSAYQRRSADSDQRDAAHPIHPATVITLLSSPSSHTSLPGAGKESVVAQATAAGMETIRREADEAASKARSLSSRTTVPGKRPIRITTVEIDAGLPWGQAALPAFSTEQGDASSAPTGSSRSGSSNSNAASFSLSTAGASGTGSATMTQRPTAMRKVSSMNSSNSWPSRDTSTQVVLNRVTALLLPLSPNKRLRASYHLYLPNESEKHLMGNACSLFNRGTQRLMRIIPTGWVDVLLSMRRQVSLRRAGLISQGPRITRSGSAGSSTSAPGSKDQGTGVNVGASSSSSSANATLSKPPRFPGVSASASSDEGYNYGTGESGPPSLPDSNSGDSGTSHGDVDVDIEDGMISSGVLSSEGGQHYRRQYHGANDPMSSTSTARGEEEEDTRGPWVGPASRDSPRPEQQEQHREEGDDHLSSSMSSSSTRTYDGSVGDSWVALGESDNVQEHQQ